MSNDCGLIRQEDMVEFKQWLDHVGVGWNPGMGIWEVIRISYAGRNCVVTRNKQENYKSPEELRPLIQQYREHQAQKTPVATIASEIDDTARLEFMLGKSRKVVIENCFTRHEVYVEEGFMGDKKYSPVSVIRRFNLWTEDENLNYKRQAIDNAINESRY